MEPLAFAILSVLTPRNAEKRFYDERVEDLPLEEKTDFVAISVQTYMARRAYALADAVITGQALESWPRFTADIMARDHDPGEGLPLRAPAEA
jgi:hypothetical protein